MGGVIIGVVGRPAPAGAACTVVFLALNASSLAQEPPATFPSETQVVLLEVVVHDKQGKPVDDVRPADVQVFEDGRRCEVAAFRLVRPGGQGEAAVAANPMTAEAASSPAARTPVAGSPSAWPGLTMVVLVFDQLSVQSAPFAYQGALDLLSRTFPPNSWFAAFQISRGMRMLQQATSEAARVRSAVALATVGGEAALRATEASEAGQAPASAGQRLEPPSAVAPPQLAAVAGTASALLAELARRVATYDSLHGLLAIVRSLQVIKARKVIVYFTDGRRLTEGADSAYESLVSEANRANVTIHTVDARGLTVVRTASRGPIDSVLDGLSAQSATRGAETSEVSATLTATQVVNRYGGPLLGHLAHDTGGLAIADVNDLRPGLAGVVDELSHYYEIVYVPPNQARDGRFRHTQVVVSRPGVAVRTRSGYFATPDTSPTLLPAGLPVMAAGVGGRGSSMANASPVKGTAGEHPQRVDAELAALLEKAGQYVSDYEATFRDIVAEETYTQWTEARQGNPNVQAIVPAQRRVTRADMVFVRLAGDLPWGTFRDVFEVDGQRVGDRDARLERLFREAPASALERARAILLESARYNLGPGTRTYNIPTLALAFLHPLNQGRFFFRRGGRRRIAGFDGAEVEFEERSRPTLVSADRGAPGNLPARGRFWIDTSRGTVLRSEVRFTIDTARFSAFVATEYRPEAGLSIWVPAEMKEECRDLPGGYRFGTLNATARYTNFRRFTVTIQEKAEQPKP